MKMSHHSDAEDIASGLHHGPAKHCESFQPSGSSEPIAVIGMAMGFPGDITSSDALWDTILQKRSTVCPVPKSRMNMAAFYHPDQSRKGQIYVDHGHFMSQDSAEFDAPFFATSTTDAASMDPQQRLLLEYTYLALENAGIPMESISGSRTSVFNGSFCVDWQYMTFRDGEQCASGAALGSTQGLNSNRISWFFNLKGNSATIDTACSSSLVCLDMGCQGLRLGNEDLSIVTGSNIMLSPDTFHSLTNLTMLSPDGQSHSFEEGGNGYGRGEGFGVVILKRVSDAIRDGDTIRGIIRNSGCNQDGRTPSITLPSSESQASLIRETYRKAGLSMAPVRFFEAHGTGTSVGDPLEASGFGSVFRRYRTAEDPLFVGAVKANIGHLEGASGIAGVIKAILVLEKATILPNRVAKLNAKIDADFMHLQFPTEPLPWPTQGLRRASVNSFGNGGTNAHVILDDVYHYLRSTGQSANHLTVCDPPALAAIQNRNQNKQRKHQEQTATAQSSGYNSPRLLLFSALDGHAVKRLTKRYASFFPGAVSNESEECQYLDDLAYTLAYRRSKLPWNTFAVVRSLRDLSQLEALTPPARQSYGAPGLAFVFTGQGAQWAGMGRELLSFPEFRRSLDHSEEFLQDIGCSWQLKEELFSTKTSRIDLPALSQPICTALQVALVDLLQSFGIAPTAVVGHSSGEIAAAYCSGFLSKTSALKLAYFRGLLAGELSANYVESGTMISIGLSEADVSQYLDVESMSDEHGPQLTVACINSPYNVTVSGSKARITDLKTVLDAGGVFNKTLPIDVAYHSPYMQAIADEYRRKIGRLGSRSIEGHSVSMISSLTGKKVAKDEALSADYWVANLVSPVKFTAAIETLHRYNKQGKAKKLDLSHRDSISVATFIEIGPHAALQRPLKDTLADLGGSESIAYESCLIRGTNAVTSLFAAVGHICSLGFKVNMNAVNFASSNRRPLALADLPGYSFDHSKSYWTESRSSSGYRFQKQGKLDLLGKPTSDWNPHQPRWRNYLRIAEASWMTDHVINGSTIYPGAGMLVMAIEAAYQLADPERAVQGIELKNVSFVRSIPITQDPNGTETQLSLKIGDQGKLDGKWLDFSLYVYEDDECYECCRGSVRLLYRQIPSVVDDGRESLQSTSETLAKLHSVQSSCSMTIDPARLYKSLAQSGFGYGPAFQRARAGTYNDTHQAVVELEPYKWVASETPQRHIIHTATLDAILHLAMAGYARGGDRVIDTMIPTYIGSIYLDSEKLLGLQGEKMSECAWLVSEDNRTTNWDAFVVNDTHSSVLLKFQDLQLTKIAGSVIEHADSARSVPDAFFIETSPDIDLLMPSDLVAICSHTSRSPLQQLLYLLSHKRSDLDILEVLPTDASLDLDLIRSMGIAGQNQQIIDCRYRSFSFASASDMHIEEAKTCLAPFERSELLSLNLSEALDARDVLGRFDVIVAPLSTIQTDMAATNVQLMLRENGFLVVPRDSNLCPQEMTSLGRISLTALGISISDDHSTVDDSPFYLYRKTTEIQLPQGLACVVIYDEKSKSQSSYLASISATLASAGFIVEANSLEAAARCYNKDAVYISILELDTPFLFNLNEANYNLLKAFFLSVVNIVWITSREGSCSPDPRYSLIQGMSRALHRELDHLRMTVVATEAHCDMVSIPHRQLVEIIHRHLGDISFRETEYIEIDGRLHVPRIQLAHSLSEEFRQRAELQVTKIRQIQNCPSLKFSMGSPGIFETLEWVEQPDAYDLSADDDVVIQTKAIGLNFKDCLIALGQLGNAVIGQECAGTVIKAGSMTGLTAGDRVILAEPGVFKTISRGKAQNVIRIPESMSFEIGASISIQFGTSWEVIHNAARLQKGETILVHAAAGGTGQAAIQIAQLVGAEIFATVGSLAKKQLLMSEYAIPETHIFSSRDTTFAPGVMRATRGKGVDVIMNSLSEEIMLASWNCISHFGRFVEIAKGAINSNANLPMAAFGKNVSFIGFDGTLYQKDNPVRARKTLQTLVDLFAEGTLRPPTQLHVYDISQLEDAMRHLQTGTSAGKIVLKVDPDSEVKTTLARKPSFAFTDHATYVIAGGLGGIGRQTTRWMAQRGAKNLILLSRSGVRSQAAAELVKELEEQRVRVEVPACDITNLALVQSIFNKLITTMPPIKGCVQASLGGKDELLESMEFENWSASVSCKSTGSWNLHQTLPSGMDFFVTLSSASGLAGIRGQTNYDAGNTFEDALARYRVSKGEKAVTFDLGAMSEDGVLAENPELLKRVLGYGTLQPIDRHLYSSLLDYYCDPSLPLLSPDQSQVAIGVGLGGSDDGLESVDYRRQPMMYPLQVLGEKQASKSPTARGDSKADHRRLFTVSQSLDDASEVVINAVVAKLGRSLASLSDAQNVNVQHPLQLYGVDSLLAVELRNWINREFLAEIAVFDTQGAATLGTLCFLVARKSKLKHEGWSLSAE